MKCLDSCVTKARKSLPTMQCHVGPYFWSKWVFMWADMSFSSWLASRAAAATDSASFCERGKVDFRNGYFRQAWLTTAYLHFAVISVIVHWTCEKFNRWQSVLNDLWCLIYGGGCKLTVADHLSITTTGVYTRHHVMPVSVSWSILRHFFPSTNDSLR